MRAGGMLSSAESHTGKLSPRYDVHLAILILILALGSAKSDEVSRMFSRKQSPKCTYRGKPCLHIMWGIYRYLVEDYHGVSNEHQPRKLENSPYYPPHPLGAAKYKSDVNANHHLRATESALAGKPNNPPHPTPPGINFAPCVLI